MFKSLHRKLVLIMVLLIISLMTVAGAFLIHSVSGFYLHEFYSQMESVFEDQTLWRDLETAIPQEKDGAEAVWHILSAYSGALGVDSRSRCCYILDGVTGRFLMGSEDPGRRGIPVTKNLAAALYGEVGDKSDLTASYMDVAIPLSRGGASYIIYIYDNRLIMQNLNTQLIMLILEALIFGLVISVLLSFLLSKTMITPIERLTAAAKRVAQGDFSHKITVGGSDEIGILTTTFNHMAQQLQETLQAVENERNKLGTLFLHMTDGVVAFSRSGAVIHSNPAAARLLALPMEKVLDYQELFGDIASLSDVLVLERAGYLKGERVLPQRNLEVLIAPFSGETQGGVLVVLHDVTAHRKTEEMRREFVANVSHELRTPLTNIRSYAETITTSEDLPPEIEKGFLQVILSESDRMAHIVQDLLTLSRFDSGHSPLQITEFSMGELIRNLQNAVLLEARQRNHTFTILAEEGLPLVKADRERIVQVLMNVVANAMKYTPDGGEISISARQNEGFLEVDVSDNGIGIPAEDRHRIFDRFYRVEKARSRESGGTGLGLSIAKEIMERHEGSIALSDKEGPGLTVRLRLKIGGPSDA